MVIAPDFWPFFAPSGESELCNEQGAKSKFMTVPELDVALIARLKEIHSTNKHLRKRNLIVERIFKYVRKRKMYVAAFLGHQYPFVNKVLGFHRFHSIR